jgi:hypothetical protein
MADRRFIDVALDPALVAGIYNGCDQWCDYCVATARCLAYKLSPPGRENRDIYGDVKSAMRESMVFLRELHEAEGLKPPEGLVQLLAESGKPVILDPIDDPLERLGRRYAILSATFLSSSGEIPLRIPKHEHGPTPREVFLFYYFQIATKIYRALASGRKAARTGDADARLDANLTAKVALLGIDRSDEALQVMALDDGDGRIERLRRLLRHLRREIEGRFPDARATVRPGLDVD